MDEWITGRGRARDVAGSRTSPAPTSPALIALLVTVLVMLLDPGANGFRFRSWLGIDDRIVNAVEPSGDGHYRFFDTQPGSKEPVAWNPCEPIPYVVNPEGAPDGWEELLDDGIAEVSDAAGLRFDYHGTTDDRGFTDRVNALGRGEPVLIGWADDDEVPKLEGDVAGLAGPVTQSRAGSAATSPAWWCSTSTPSTSSRCSPTARPTSRRSSCTSSGTCSASTTSPTTAS